MQHRSPRRLADRVEVDLRQHDREDRPAVPGGGDALAHRGDEDTIEIGIRDGRRALDRGRGDDDGRRSLLWIAEQTHQRRKHHGPALAFHRALGCAKHGEAHVPECCRRDVTALEKALNRATKSARRERKPFGRDRRETPPGTKPA